MFDFVFDSDLDFVFDFEFDIVFGFYFEFDFMLDFETNDHENTSRTPPGPRSEPATANPYKTNAKHTFQFSNKTRTSKVMVLLQWVVK